MLAAALAHLVHSEISERVLPAGPLAATLRRMVPHVGGALTSGWSLVEPMLAALRYEERFDANSAVHSPAARDEPTRLALACGARPPGWGPRTTPRGA